MIITFYNDIHFGYFILSSSGTFLSLRLQVHYLFGRHILKVAIQFVFIPFFVNMSVMAKDGDRPSLPTRYKIALPISCIIDNAISHVEIFRYIDTIKIVGDNNADLIKIQIGSGATTHTLFYEGATRDLPFRWRIYNGSYWSVLGSPRRDVHFANRPLSKIDLHGLTKLMYLYSIDPISDIASDNTAAFGLDAWSFTELGTFDVMPINPYEVVVAFAWKKKLRIWRGVSNEFDDTPDKGQELNWNKTVAGAKLTRQPRADDMRAAPPLVLDTAIDEAFQLFGNNDRAFLVTSTGGVHACRLDPKETATRLVWDGAKRPVVGLVYESATGRAWAFTRAADGPGGRLPAVYFELADPPVPVPYDAAKVPADPADPAAPALARARILVADKKVTLAK